MKFDGGSNTVQFRRSASNDHGSGATGRTSDWGSATESLTRRLEVRVRRHRFGLAGENLGNIRNRLEALKSGTAVSFTTDGLTKPELMKRQSGSQIICCQRFSMRKVMSVRLRSGAGCVQIG